jgi:hypothetical protein
VLMLEGVWREAKSGKVWHRLGVSRGSCELSLRLEGYVKSRFVMVRHTFQELGRDGVWKVILDNQTPLGLGAASKC